MARRVRTVEETWYDLFADWDAEDQAAALRVLAALHRQKQRERDKSLTKVVDVPTARYEPEEENE